MKIIQDRNMIEIRPNCVQNIKQNLSKQKFAVLNDKAISTTPPTGPVFQKINNKQEMSNVLKFFLNSFNHSAENAGTSGKKHSFEKKFEGFTQRVWAYLEKLQIHSKNTVVEVVKDKDKLLGCYSLSLNKNLAYINFLAVDPKIKNSKTTVSTLLNMAQRISEQAKSKNINIISWTTDRRNSKAYRLFDKFPAYKHSSHFSDVDFYVNISDFDETLKKYM